MRCDAQLAFGELPRANFMENYAGRGNFQDGIISAGDRREIFRGNLSGQEMSISGGILRWGI